MVVPEQRHLLLQRALAVHHPEHPALTGIVDVVARVESAAAARHHAQIGRIADVGVHVVGHPFEVDEPIDRRIQAEIGVGVHFVGTAAETGAPQQVLDLLFASCHVLSLT